MGYLKAPENDLLHLPSNPEFWVRMKRQPTYGDSRAAQSALMQFSAGRNGNTGAMVTEMEIGAFLGTLTLRLIVEWNLTDENDQPLALTLANLDRLSDEDGEFLALEAQNRKAGRKAEEQVPFQKLSPPPSEGTKSKTQK